MLKNFSQVINILIIYIFFYLLIKVIETTFYLSIDDFEIHLIIWTITCGILYFLKTCIDNFADKHILEKFIIITRLVFVIVLLSAYIGITIPILRSIVLNFTFLLIVFFLFAFIDRD